MTDVEIAQDIERIHGLKAAPQTSRRRRGGSRPGDAPERSLS